jgi:hypothetical protein
MRIVLPLTVFSILASVATAQEVATRSVVTPKGVFNVTTQRVQQPPTAPRPFVTPGTSSVGPVQRWVYPNPAATPWITANVSSGNVGTFAWLGQDLNGQRVSFLASTDDQNPAVPIYEDPLMGSDVISVAAADKAPFAVVARRNLSSGVNEIRLYSGFSSTPVATANVNVASGNGFEVAMSDDGERVVVGYNDPSVIPSVDVYDTNGGTTLSNPNTYTVTGFNTFRELDISGDGSVILLATDTADVLLDAATGSQIFLDNTTVSVDAHAVNRDGTAFGRGGFDLGAWTKNAGTYNRVVTFTDASLGFMVSTTCDISADGTTFAAAAYDATDANKIRMYVFNLTPTGSTMLWTFSKNSTGSLQNVPSAVSISDNGKWIALASWGGQMNSQPEILLFDRDVGNTPVGSIDTPGSAFDCDLSGDGQFLIAGTKAVHANDFGNGGEGYSLDRGGQTFRLLGTPSIGRTVTLQDAGTPGEQVLIAASLALLPVGLPVAGFTGTFDLNPSFLILMPIPIGTIPGGGVLSFSAVIPNVPSVIGQTVYTQAIRPASHALDNHLALPLTQ